MTINRQPRLMSAGYSLLEMMVVVGLMAMLLIGAVTMFMTTLAGSSKSEMVSAVKQDGDYAITQMERTIRGASEWTACGGSDLTVKVPQSGGSNIEVTFSKVASGSVDRVAVEIDAGGTEFLTSVGLNVQDLSFDCPSDKDVEIKLVMDTGTTDRQSETALAEFQTRVKLRN